MTTSWQEAIASQNINDIKSALLQGNRPNNLAANITISNHDGSVGELTLIEILFRNNAIDEDIRFIELAVELLLAGAPMPRREQMLAMQNAELSASMLRCINTFINEKRLSIYLLITPAVDEPNFTIRNAEMLNEIYFRQYHQYPNAIHELDAFVEMLGDRSNQSVNVLREQQHQLEALRDVVRESFGLQHAEQSNSFSFWSSSQTDTDSQNINTPPETQYSL